MERSVISLITIDKLVSHIVCSILFHPSSHVIFYYGILMIVRII